jgi:hypothetical protein
MGLLTQKHLIYSQTNPAVPCSPHQIPRPAAIGREPDRQTLAPDPEPPAPHPPPTGPELNPSLNLHIEADGATCPLPDDVTSDPCSHVGICRRERRVHNRLVPLPLLERRESRLGYGLRLVE